VDLSLDPVWLEATSLACVRVTAFLVVAPPFSHRSIPARIKAMLGLGLALAMGPQAAEGYAPGSTGDFVLALTAELITGLALGFLVSLVFSAIMAAGSLIDLFGGFQLAQAYDPQSMVNGAQFTRLLQMTALALLFSSDGYQLVLGGLGRSFSAVPLGGRVDLAPTAAGLIDGMTQLFLAAVQIAGPLLVVLVLADIGLGLLTRVAPALNAFSLGFPLKVLVTVVVAAVAFVALPQIVAALTNDAVGLMGVVR
jgi:flagellar biosynthetic protein FliR